MSKRQAGPAGLALILLALGLAAGSAQAAVPFSTMTTAGTGGEPRGVRTVDFNADGKLDVLTANFSSSVSVLLGNGDGTFLPAVTTAAGGNTYDVATGDIDGDGDLDVATADVNGRTISLLRGDGTGALASAVTYTTGGNLFVYTVQMSDLDGDGRADVAYAGANGLTRGVGVRLGNADGTLGAETLYAGPDGTRGLVLADLDGDGKTDAATANEGGSVSVLLGNGDGTFDARNDFPTGSGAVQVSAGDLDHDGDLDLATANRYSPGNLGVLLNDGHGAFAAPSFVVPGGLQDHSGDRWYSGPSPENVQIADVDGDGNLDLISVNAADDSESIALGRGDGTFDAVQNLEVGNYPSGLAVGDLDGDHRPDFVATHPFNAVSIRLNQAPAPAAPSALTLAPGATGTSPAPSLSGTATGTTVRIYDSADCSGTAVATGTRASFAGEGLVLSVPSGTTTTFTAQAVDAFGQTSGCSAAVVYVNTFVAPPTTTTTTTTASEPEAPAPPAPAAADATPAEETPAGLVADPRLISGLHASKTCVRRPGAVTFRFTLGEASIVRYKLVRRVGGPAWRACPKPFGGRVPANVKPVNLSVMSEDTESLAGGQHGVSVARAASRPRFSRSHPARRGAQRLALSRLVAGQDLAPGTYWLVVTATSQADQTADVGVVKFWVTG